MAEAIQYMFDHQEVTETLIKKQDIHEGQWILSVEFGFAAATVPTGLDGKTLQPAAINFIQHVGIKKHEGPPNNLSVDASVVNPATAVKNPRRPGGRRATSRREKK